MTISENLQSLLTRLGPVRGDEARRTAEWLLEAATGLRRATLYAYPERELDATQQALLDAWGARCAAGEPVQYVIGTAAFCGLVLEVGPDVLIPRPETEEVVGCALEQIAGMARPRVLDAGTGSGCIALALKAARPEADVHALDVSERALAVARRNAAANRLAVTFHAGDLLADVLPGVPGDLDLLVSNPPYIPDAEAEGLEPHVREHEPALALFSGPDPLQFYRALARHAEALVRPGGAVVVETHAYHAEATATCFSGPAFGRAEVRRDLSGRPRMVWTRRR